MSITFDKTKLPSSEGHLRNIVKTTIGPEATGGDVVHQIRIRTECGTVERVFDLVQEGRPVRINAHIPVGSGANGMYNKSGEEITIRVENNEPCTIEYLGYYVATKASGDGDNGGEIELEGQRERPEEIEVTKWTLARYISTQNEPVTTSDDRYVTQAITVDEGDYFIVLSGTDHNQQYITSVDDPNDDIAPRNDILGIYKQGQPGVKSEYANVVIPAGVKYVRFGNCESILPRDEVRIYKMPAK